MRKKILKWIIGILLTPLILFVILSTLLYVPAVQDYAVRKTTGILSETTGMQIQIGKLRLAFLFDLSLRDVNIANAQGVKLIDVNELGIDLNFSSLLRGEIKVDGFDIYDADVDTQDLITGVIIKGHLGRFNLRSHGVKLPQEMAIVNAAVLDKTDVEVILQDTTTVDTVESAPPTWRLALEKVAISNTRFKLRMPGDTMVIGMGLKEARLNGAYIDLEKSLYKARSFDLSADQFFTPTDFKGAVQAGSRAEGNAHIQAPSLLIGKFRQNRLLPVGNGHGKRRLFRTDFVGLSHISGNIRILPAFLQKLHGNLRGTDPRQIPPGQRDPRQLFQRRINKSLQHIFRLSSVPFIIHRRFPFQNRSVLSADMQTNLLAVIVNQE